MAPPFDAHGNLPPGTHKVDWDEILVRFGGSPRRQWLLEGLKQAIEVLASAGCRVIYLDGSFVTSKLEPNDYDACWAMDGVRLADLHKAEPSLFDFSDRRRAQKMRFRGEFFPADLTESGSGKTFLQFFQTDPNTGNPKGVLELEIAGALA
jgi:hypothetical protein